MKKWDLMLVAGTLLISSASLADDRGTLAPFTEEALARGLNYRVKYLSPFDVITYGQGIAIADLNANGHQDIIVLGHESGMAGIFQNLGTGTFANRSYHATGAPKVIVPYASGIAVADFTGNGLKDVYITQVDGAPGVGNVLLRNEGNFNFTDVSTAAGVANVGRSHAAVWGDFDNDGWLDLYVTNYTLPSLQANPTYRNQLYRNRGDGTFENVTVGSTVDDPGASLAVAFTDINRNGWLDLYLANDKGHQYHANHSWRNNQGQFESTCDISGACLGLWSMAVAVGDVTGNGYPDLYVTNLPHHGGYNGWNPLLINNGDETFEEKCTEAGVCQFIFSWSAMFFDFNNNGWLDLYVGNQTQDNRLYANYGSFPLVDVTQQTNAGGSPGHTYNVAVGDLTGNGAIDIVSNDYGSNNQTRNVQLLINNEGATRNWIRFQVVGHAGNRHAIGSNIEVTADGHTQWREIYAGGNNYKSQNELVFHFGLGDSRVADEIVVTWPGSQFTRTLSTYPAQHVWTIYPPDMLGDANDDGVIDISDLLALLSAWGPVQPGTEKMDMNGNGSIGTSDLLLLLSQWGS